jgi:plasmid stabilization system protein ParE
VRLVWSDRATAHLETIADRAPQGAFLVYRAVMRLGHLPFPGMYRRVRGSSHRHILVAAPYVILYRVDGDTITVQEIRDGRKVRTSW